MEATSASMGPAGHQSAGDDGSANAQPPNHLESIFVLLCTPFVVGSGFGLHGMKQLDHYWNLRSRRASNTLWFDTFQ